MKRFYTILLGLIIETSVMVIANPGGQGNNTATHDSAKVATSQTATVAAHENLDTTTNLIVNAPTQADTIINNDNYGIKEDSLVSKSHNILAKTIVDKVISMSQLRTDSIPVDSALLATIISQDYKMLSLKKNKGSMKQTKYDADSVAIRKEIKDSLQQAIHYQTMVDSVADGIVILNLDDYDTLNDNINKCKNSQIWQNLTWVGLVLVIILIAVVIYLLVEVRKAKAGSQSNKHKSETLVKVSKPLEYTPQKNFEALDKFILKNKKH